MGGVLNNYTVVIPNRFEDIIQPLIRSIRAYIPKPHPRIIIVADGHKNSYGFEQIPYPGGKFQFAISANAGIVEAGEDDVILMNDDISLLQRHFFRRLAEEADYPDVGILSPLIMGGVGNKLQYYHQKSIWWRPEERHKDVTGEAPVCFPCVYLKRDMIDKIGLLETGIVGYGGEDNEYCLRARAYRWRTVIAGQLVVRHGDGGPELDAGRGRTWSKSYARL